MRKRGLVVLAAAVVLLAALVVAVKAKVIRPNMIFVPKGVQGVDVSEYQGAVDFEVLSNDGIEFVYAKATEGATYADGRFAATCAEASGSSVALGAYHFFSFDSSGADQAANFIAAATQAWGDPAVRSLVPAVDVEWYGDKKQKPPAAEDVRRELRAFVDAVEAACGHKPLIYVGNDIYDRYLRGSFDDCDLWVSCRKWPVWFEWPQGGWTIWQYSDVGELAGAANDAGHVDLDVLAEGAKVDDLLM
jgi:lysozyme